MNMAVLVMNQRSKGLVILMHGFLSFKEHPLLLETAEIFKGRKFTTVSFDTANSSERVTVKRRTLQLPDISKT
jgi:fermentation-respiration switch protein FrsA (DUF1100 family)